MNLPVIVAGAALLAATLTLVLTEGTPAGTQTATGVRVSNPDETASKRLLESAG